MYTGMSYIEAVQKLFEIADISYSFGEVGVRTKHSYKYPKEVPINDKQRIYKYLKSRGISDKTADYLDIREDEKGNLAFNYYDHNDTLTMVKYRPSRKIKKGEAKNWCQEGADTSPILYNMNKINTSSPLLITCGELDCAAAIEAGWMNAVSIPLGDSNTQWCKECFEWLEQFEEIIICPDNDDSGTKFRKTVVPMLGSWRCKVANVPEYVEKESGEKRHLKDVNEVLYFLGKEAVLEMITSAQDTPVPSLVDFSTIQEMDVEDLDGITIGLHDIDKELIKFFMGSFNVVSGIPGSGKTSILNQFICQSLDQDYGVWVFSKELPAWMSKNWILHQLAGDRHLEKKMGKNDSVYYKVPIEIKNKIDKYYSEKLMLYRDDYPNDVESIQQSMEDSARKYASKLFIIDNLMCVDLKTTEANRNDKQTEFVNWLIAFSMKYQVCTILVCHPNKTQEYSENIGLYQISGTSNIINLAHRAIGLRRITAKEKKGIPNPSGRGWKSEPCKYDVIVSMIKDRFTGKSNFESGLYYAQGSRRFYSNYDEYAHQYNWDKGVYKDSLSIPEALLENEEEDEVYGTIKEAAV